MREIIASLLVVITAFSIPLAIPGEVKAQSVTSSSMAADGNTNGVITVIQVDQDTKLVGFVLSTKNGELVEMSVDDSTSFGLRTHPVTAGYRSSGQTRLRHCCVSRTRGSDSLLSLSQLRTASQPP